MLSSVAQGESENKSEAIKWSINGGFKKTATLPDLGTPRLYHRRMMGIWAVVEERSPVVRFIDETLGWMSVKEIADELTRLRNPHCQRNGEMECRNAL